VTTLSRQNSIGQPKQGNGQATQAAMPGFYPDTVFLEVGSDDKHDTPRFIISPETEAANTLSRMRHISDFKGAYQDFTEFGNVDGKEDATPVETNYFMSPSRMHEAMYV
jgi:hypothetical protein